MGRHPIQALTSAVWGLSVSGKRFTDKEVGVWGPWVCSHLVLGFSVPWEHSGLHFHSRRLLEMDVAQPSVPPVSLGTF